jgi:hypothetical protein
MMTKTKNRGIFAANRLLVLNEPNAPRLSPALACEIGLLESLLLLQLDFLIAIAPNDAHHWREGVKWAWQTVSQWHALFPFASERTIMRALDKLEERGLIRVGCFNRRRYDKTRWYTLDAAGIATLTSVTMKCETPADAAPQAEPSGDAEKRHDKLSPSNMTNCHHRCGQIVTIQHDNLSVPIPETSQRLPQESPQEKTSPTSSKSAAADLQRDNELDFFIPDDCLGGEGWDIPDAPPEEPGTPPEEAVIFPLETFRRNIGAGKDGKPRDPDSDHIADWGRVRETYGDEVPAAWLEAAEREADIQGDADKDDKRVPSDLRWGFIMGFLQTKANDAAIREGRAAIRAWAKGKRKAA